MLIALVDFVIAFFIFFILLYVYSVNVNYHAFLLLPISVMMVSLSAVGCGTLLAALNIKYRDVRYILPFLVQGLLFLTPVLYPINISSNRVVQFLLTLNPVSGALELMRSLFTDYEINYEVVLISSSTTIVLFVIGILYFRKTENHFADLA